MKKIIYLLFLFPIFFLISCGNDNKEIEDVDRFESATNFLNILSIENVNNGVLLDQTEYMDDVLISQTRFEFYKGGVYFKITSNGITSEAYGILSYENNDIYLTSLTTNSSYSINSNIYSYKGITLYETDQKSGLLEHLNQANLYEPSYYNQANENVFINKKDISTTLSGLDIIYSKIRIELNNDILYKLETNYSFNVNSRTINERTINIYSYNQNFDYYIMNTNDCH